MSGNHNKFHIQMQRTPLILCVALLTKGLDLPAAPVKAAPASAEQLRSEFEQAIKSSDTNAIKTLLYNWQAVSDETNSMGFENITHNFFGATIEGVTLGPLNPGEDYSKPEQMEVADGIFLFTPNLTASGIIHVKSQSADTNDSPSDMELPYGETNHVFYLRDTIMQKIPKTKANGTPVPGDAQPTKRTSQASP